MYYYIIAQPTSSLEKRLIQRIKTLIGETGIAGETVSPSPARTIEELTQIGSSKGYSTVVAIGNDLFVNKVASALLSHRQKLKEDKKVVLGVIPFDLQRSFFAKLVGIRDFKQAVETLKFRKLSPIKTGLVEPNKHFLSPIMLTSNKACLVTIKTTDFMTQLKTTKLSVSKDLQLASVDETYPGSVLVQTWRWLLGKDQNLSTTMLRHQSFTIESPQGVPIQLEGETIAKTPVNLRRFELPLHLITTRDRMVM